MAPKLTKNSLAVKTLNSMLSSGELSGTDNPKSVWESNHLFKSHKLPNFRTCYNRLRKQYSLKNSKLLHHFFDLFC